MKKVISLLVALFVSITTSACTTDTSEVYEDVKVDPGGFTNSTEIGQRLRGFQPVRYRATPATNRTGSFCTALPNATAMEFGKTPKGTAFLIVPMPTDTNSVTTTTYGCRITVSQAGAELDVTAAVSNEGIVFTLAWVHQDPNLRTSNISMTTWTPDGFDYIDQLTLLASRDALTMTLGPAAVVDDQSVWEFFKQNHDNLEISFEVLGGLGAPGAA